MNIVTTATPSSGTTITGGAVAANSTTGAIAFTSLKITTTATSVTLTFAVNGTSSIASVTSSSISISQAPASQLILNPTTTSYTITAGQVLSPSPTVLTADAKRHRRSRNADAVRDHDEFRGHNALRPEYHEQRFGHCRRRCSRAGERHEHNRRLHHHGLAGVDPECDKDGDVDGQPRRGGSHCILECRGSRHGGFGHDHVRDRQRR